ncbi:MAG: MFS transporter [Promethearchaeota archaeon]
MKINSPPKNALSIYFVTVIIRIASGAAGFMLGLFSRTLIDEGNLLILEASFVSITFFASELLFSPIFGLLSDRFGRKEFIILAGIFGICFNILLYASTHLSTTLIISIFWIFLLAEFLAGISSGSNNPAIWAIYGHEISTIEERGRRYSIYTILNGGGLFGGWIIGGILWDISQPNHLGFLALALLYALASLLCLITYQENEFRSSKERSFRESLQLVQKESKLVLFAPVWIFITMILGVVIFSLPILLSGSNNDKNSESPISGFSGTQIAILMGLLAICLFFGVLFWGSVSDMVSRRLVMLVGCFSLFVGSIILFGILEKFPELLEQPFQFPLGILWIIEFIVLLGCGGLPPAAMAYVSDIAPDKEAGNTLGFFILFYTVSHILGAGIAGFVIDSVGLEQGLQGIMLTVAILSVISAIGVSITVKENDYS